MSNASRRAIATTFEPMRTVSLARPFQKYLGTIPDTVLSVASMMSVAERRFLHGLAKEYYTGEGVIIDAGIFLGASTRCFGEGVAANPAAAAAKKAWSKPVISFERGLVNPGMPPFFERNKVDIDAKPGESFAHAVRANIAPVAEYVDLRIGDILETGIVDHPIEILFLDVLKMPEITKFAIESYFTKLILGRSIVIQQDYFYELLPFIKSYQEFFADHFEFIGEIGSTAVFLCIEAITPERAAEASEPRDAEAELRLASIALQRSVDPYRRFLMALSRVRAVRKASGLKAAAEYLKVVKADFPDQVAETRLARIREPLRAAERFVLGKKVAEEADLEVSE